MKPNAGYAIFCFFVRALVCPIVLYLLCRGECGLLLMPFPGALHSIVQAEAGNKDVGDRWGVVSRDCRGGSTERSCIGMEGEMGTTDAGMPKDMSENRRRTSERGLMDFLQLGRTTRRPRLHPHQQGYRRPPRPYLTIASR